MPGSSWGAALHLVTGIKRARKGVFARENNIFQLLSRYLEGHGDSRRRGQFRSLKPGQWQRRVLALHAAAIGSCVAH